VGRNILHWPSGPTEAQPKPGSLGEHLCVPAKNPGHNGGVVVAKVGSVVVVVAPAPTLVELPNRPVSRFVALPIS
jgi:hypothetical protein